MTDFSAWLTSPFDIVKVVQKKEMQQREEIRVRRVSREEETLHRDGGREEKKEKKGRKGQKKIRHEANASPNQVKITLYQHRFRYSQAGISRAQKFLHVGHCASWRGSIDSRNGSSSRNCLHTIIPLIFPLPFPRFLSAKYPRTSSSTGR
jgi:hypothetical protein